MAARKPTAHQSEPPATHLIGSKDAFKQALNEIFLTPFDRQYPITIECSQKVGEILKYLNPDQGPQIKYSFYM